MPLIQFIFTCIATIIGGLLLYLSLWIIKNFRPPILTTILLEINAHRYKLQRQWVNDIEMWLDEEPSATNTVMYNGFSNCFGFEGYKIYTDHREPFRAVVEVPSNIKTSKALSDINWMLQLTSKEYEIVKQLLKFFELSPNSLPLPCVRGKHKAIWAGSTSNGNVKLHFIGYGYTNRLNPKSIWTEKYGRSPQDDDPLWTATTWGKLTWIDKYIRRPISKRALKKFVEYTKSKQ